MAVSQAELGKKCRTKAHGERDKKGRLAGVCSWVCLCIHPSDLTPQSDGIQACPQIHETCLAVFSPVRFSEISTCLLTQMSLSLKPRTQQTCQPVFSQLQTDSFSRKPSPHLCAICLLWITQGLTMADVTQFLLVGESPSPVSLLIKFAIWSHLPNHCCFVF